MERSTIGIHEVELYSKSSGLSDKLDPVRSPEGSVVKGENVVLDLSGSWSRRDGTTLVSSTACHSLFSCGKYGLGVFAGNLSLIESDLSVTTLIAVGNSTVSYVLSFDGRYNVVYFVNGVIAGKVVNKSYSAWSASSYVGVASTRSKVIERLSSVPAGQLLEIWHGRMFIAKGDLLYFSNERDFSAFEAVSVIPFDGYITMLAGLDGGLYVGTENGVFFLPGEDISIVGIRKVYSSGSTKGVAKKFTATETASQAQFEMVAFTVVGEGFCVGDGSGNVTNHSFPFTDFSTALAGASYITDDKHFIVSL